MPQRKLGLLQGIDESNIINISDDIEKDDSDDPPKQKRHTTRQRRNGRAEALYNMKYHPMDEFLKPSRDDKKKNLLEVADSDASGVESILDFEESKSTQARSEKRWRKERTPTRWSTRERRRGSLVTYDINVHPQDHLLREAGALRRRKYDPPDSDQYSAEDKDRSKKRQRSSRKANPGRKRSIKRQEARSESAETKTQGPMPENTTRRDCNSSLRELRHPEDEKTLPNVSEEDDKDRAFDSTGDDSSTVHVSKDLLLPTPSSLASSHIDVRRYILDITEKAKEIGQLARGEDYGTTLDTVTSPATSPAENVHEERPAQEVDESQSDDLNYRIQNTHPDVPEDIEDVSSERHVGTRLAEVKGEFPDGLTKEDDPNLTGLDTHTEKDELEAHENAEIKRKPSNTATADQNEPKSAHRMPVVVEETQPRDGLHSGPSSPASSIPYGTNPFSSQQRSQEMLQADWVLSFLGVPQQTQYNPAHVSSTPRPATQITILEKCPRGSRTRVVIYEDNSDPPPPLRTPSRASGQGIGGKENRQPRAFGRERRFQR